MADGILTLNAMMPEKDLTGEKMLEPGLGAGIGLAFPWSIRPKLKSRAEYFGAYYLDLYDYGSDSEEGG